MLTLRNRDERGASRYDWLDSRHTFSFDRYYDPRHMGFRSLRVINDDRVAPGAGFPTHGHRDMEILSYVLEGTLAHKDSMGTGSTIAPGDVQRMSAGTGVTHSEYNYSKTEPVHFLQIWVSPERRGTEPGYEQRRFSVEQKRGKLCLVASQDGRDGSLTIHQDVAVYATILHSGEAVMHLIREGRHAWVQLASGSVTVNGIELKAGDGVAASEEPTLEIAGKGSSELLLFDLA